MLGSTAEGFLSLFAADTPPPLASTINFPGSLVRANNAILQRSVHGNASLTVAPVVAGGGLVHFILDINGYFQ